MIKSLFYLTIGLLFIGQALAQNRPAPEYLTKQAFPDSVLQVELLPLETGDQTSFGDVLASLKGQKVVIDFWASWCKDCIVSLPELKSLMQKSGEKVTYLMLSVDKEEAKWKAAIERFDIPGLHYRFSAGWKNALTNYIDLDWVPRYVILDEKGKVILPKSIKADDKELIKKATK